jgi:PAS domain S-box-containing protein
MRATREFADDPNALRAVDLRAGTPPGKLIQATSSRSSRSWRHLPSPSGTGRSPSGFFARLTIQGKLVLSFGLLLLLVAVVAAGGLLGVRAVRRSYEAAIDHGLGVERRASEVRNELLEARRNEKDFLLARRRQSREEARREHLVPHQAHVRRIRELVAELSAGIARPMATAAARIEEDLVALTPYVNVYQEDFESAVTLVTQQAAAEDVLDAQARAIEDAVVSVRGARDVLAFRRRAEEYRIKKGDPIIRADLIARIANLQAGDDHARPQRSRARSSGATAADARLFLRFVAALDRLVAIERETAAKLADFQLAAAVVEPLVRDIATAGSEIAATEIKEARMASDQTVLLVGAAFALVLLTGIGLAYRLGRQIRTPLRNLARTAEAVGAGELGARASVDSLDEIGTLAMTFNAMTTQLSMLVASLEEQVTERRGAEEALRASQRRLQDIIDNSTAVVSVKDLSGRYLLVNRRFEQIFHLDRNAVIGQTDQAFFPEELAAVFRGNDQRALDAGRAIELEEVAPQDDGLHTYISIKGPLCDEGGRPYAVCGISTDITERKQVEEQLRQSQKMEAIGQLAGGVAHDFNNLLTAINGYSELMLERMTIAHPFFEHAREIAKAGERAAGLTRQLLAYSRKQVMEPRLWAPNIVVGELEAILRRLVGAAVTLDLQLAPDAGTIRVDRGQVEQILLNLAVNARDAMITGGRLTIATANVDLGAPRGAAAADVGRGPQVLLSVTDTGAGMGPDVKARIFEPFFTTKEVGKGTGLGLSVVYGIVKQSGGTIAVDSAPGSGTTFSIYFPRVEEGQSDAGANVTTRLPLLGGSETVLLVEDEESVRRFAARALEAHGYSVISAAGGREALTAFEARKADIDLVVTDVVMPDLGGRALAAYIRGSAAALPVLYISGYAAEAVVSQGMLEEGEHFLQKPFSHAELLRAVRDILDQLDERATVVAGASGDPKP